MRLHLCLHTIKDHVAVVVWIYIEVGNMTSQIISHEKNNKAVEALVKLTIVFRAIQSFTLHG